MRAREALAGPWLAGLSAWRALGGRAVPPGAFRILLLHDVPPDRRGRLAALLDHIAAHGGFVTPDIALARLAGARVPAAETTPAERASWLVTFDDGFESNRVVAETVLAPRGIRAVFFVCPGLIELAPAARREAVARCVHEGRVDPAALPTGKVLMDWDDLASLVHAGHTVGAHTLTHRRLAAARDAQLEDEVGGAAERIASRLGVPADWFAWPFGDVGSIDAAALAVIARHCRVCRSGIRGLNAPGGHRLAVFADHVDLDATPAWQRLVIAGGLDGRYRAARRRLAEMIATCGDHAMA